jgi:hypothetical protein
MYKVNEIVKVISPQVDFNLEVKVISVKEDLVLVEWEEGHVKYSEHLKTTFNLEGEEDSYKDMKFLILKMHQIQKINA